MRWVVFTCTSLPLNLYTSIFGCGCGFGFEQKFWRIDGFGKKKARIGGFAYPYSPPSVRKCMKSWLAQGSLGRRVTLLPGTTFLHINGALEPINIWGIRKKKERRGLRKRGVKIHPFHLPWIQSRVLYPQPVSQPPLLRKKSERDLGFGLWSGHFTQGFIN